MFSSRKKVFNNSMWNNNGTKMELDLDKIKQEKTLKELLEFSIINIDKPSGPTSFWTSQFVKRSLSLKKTSHLGTLDPQVSGVLPVALGRACRLSEYLMHRNKIYIGIMRTHKDISLEVLKKEMSRFLGKIKQLPPIRSRVKRAERVREVKSFKIIEKSGKDVLFESEVQAGTYIRKLCSDLGEKIGGAHMLELRRIKAGLFSETGGYPSINLYDFESYIVPTLREKELRKILIPGEIVASLLPSIQIRKDVVKKVLTGSPIFPSFLSDVPSITGRELEKGDKLCIFSEERFIGVYNFVGSENLTAKPEFVLN
jgi:H/ACA ribonucleoprotein complex subunit 4